MARDAQPLREAFVNMDWLINIRLASDGMLNYALRSLLLRSEEG